MSTVYSNFYNPQTLSLLFCLHEAHKMTQNQQVDIKSDLVTYLLNKILSISDSKNISKTNTQFEAQLLSVTNNQQFLIKYQNCIKNIDCFNKFYGQVSNILKNLRSMRSSKLEQSNLVDFFVRRLYIYFEKLDFKEIVEIYQGFVDYVNGVEKSIKQHQFMLTKSIEEVKFNLQNYGYQKNPEQIQSIIEKLAEDDHTFKTSYLKGIIYSQKGTPAQSSHYLRRYFDKNLSNLFQDRISQGNISSNSNKINHCILSGAYTSLQLQHLDQCLQSISQGLRISQNNADEQSINNCIIYLYNVAQKLGKFRQQILLSEHAITHSLNQNNLLLTLYSCLSCSMFEKKFDCADSSLSLLKTREVSWKDALHFAKKKLHSHYQNNCRNIFHLYRNLLIPSFIHKLAIVCQIPALKNLLLNDYYKSPQFLQLAIYKQFTGQTPLSKNLQKLELFSKMNFNILLEHKQSQLTSLQETCPPFERIKIWTIKNQILLRRGSLSACYNSSRELLAYCQNHGFVKNQYIEILIMIGKVLSINQLHYDGLVEIEEAIRLCKMYNLGNMGYYCAIIKANVLLRIGHLSGPIDTLRQIQQKGHLTQLDIPYLRKFHETKLLLNQKILNIVTQSYQKQKIQKNLFSCYTEVIKLSIVEKQIGLTHRWIKKMHKFIQKHPVYMTNAPTLQKASQYCLKIMNAFKKCQIQTMKEDELVERALSKLKKIIGI